MKRVYIDLDETIASYKSHFHGMKLINPHIEFPQSQYGFFLDLKPIPGAKEGVLRLKEMGFDVWFLTRPSIKNPLCYTEKRVWMENHFGIESCEKFIICPDKSLLKGDYLIDDCLWPDFEGTQLLFGSKEFPNWDSVILYFLKNITI